MNSVPTPTPERPLPPRTRVLAVVGPTAVGKSAIAEKIALTVGGEIVSADSMQVYRGMDIGTAKPAPAQRLVPHHCIDVAEPGEPFSAALFQHCAREAIDDISTRQLLPVLAGGTGLYVRAAIDDWHFPAGEQVDNPARTRYEAIAAEQGAGALHKLLADRDAASAALVHPNNVRRVVRALELVDLGESYAAQHSGFSARESVYDASLIGLTMDRERLYERIEMRVDAMIDQGLVAEVARLLAAGFRDALTAAQAIGYKELVAVVEDDAPLPDAVAAIKQATRRYAKRQLTWFRADPRVTWVDIGGLALDSAVEAVLRELDWV